MLESGKIKELDFLREHLIIFGGTMEKNVLQGYISDSGTLYNNVYDDRVDRNFERTNKIRESNYDLLRIISAFAVIMLHVSSCAFCCSQFSDAFWGVSSSR